MRGETISRRSAITGWRARTSIARSADSRPRLNLKATLHKDEEVTDAFAQEHAVFFPCRDRWRHGSRRPRTAAASQLECSAPARPTAERARAGDYSECRVVAIPDGRRRESFSSRRTTCEA